MKTIRQLLREFLLPLLLAAAWTVYNVFDKPAEVWSTRKVVNVLGPAFFFMSWLVAQWYRVAKQQRVEHELTAIHSGVKALHEPLLPCGLFLTLTIDASEEDVRRLFGEDIGYRAFGQDRGMPPPPLGLPPGLGDGRVLWPGGYLDYKGGILQAAGVFRPDHPGYNMIHRHVKHTVASLPAPALEIGRLRNEPLLATPAVRVEIFLEGRPLAGETAPSLALESSMPDAQVVRAFALDEQVFVDVVVKTLSPSRAVSSAIHSRSLDGAFLRIMLDFFYLEGLSDLSNGSWPTVHNLQFWLGGAGRQLLTFTPDVLAAQVARENPIPLARGQVKCPQIVFECELVESIFASAFRSIS
jgi:hypothetical protein